MHRAHVGQVGQLGAAREAVGRAPRRRGRRRGRRGPGRARRPPPTRRSGPSPCRSCRPARSSRRPGSAVAPAPVSRAASVDQSSTEAWWQCGWATTSTPSSDGGVQASEARCSASVTTPSTGSPSSSPASWRSTARQDGSSTTTGTPASRCGRSRSTSARQRPAGGVELAGADQGQPAALVALGVHLHPLPGGLEHPHGGVGDLGGEAVGEGVGPDHDVGRSRAGPRPGGSAGGGRAPAASGACPPPTCARPAAACRAARGWPATAAPSPAAGAAAPACSASAGRRLPAYFWCSASTL